MAKIHIIERTTSGKIRAALHFTTPATDNSAGFAWRLVLTTLGLIGGPDSHGPWAVGAEATSIEAGDIIEITAELNDIGGTPAQRAAAITSEADRVIAQYQTDMAQKYDYAGLTIGSVS